MGGFLATGATAALFTIGVLPEGTQPELVVAAGITVLLSGFAVVGTVQDAIGGYNVRPRAGPVEVGVLSAGLLTGVVLGLKVAAGAGVMMDVAAELPHSGARIAAALAARRWPPPSTPSAATRRCSRCWSPRSPVGRVAARIVLLTS